MTRRYFITSKDEQGKPDGMYVFAVHIEAAIYKADQLLRKETPDRKFRITGATEVSD